MNIIQSTNGVPIRFPDERWKHITLGHPEMADYYFEILETVKMPDAIYSRYGDVKLRSKNLRNLFINLLL